MDKLQIKIGCVADDFTGASDAASFLQKAGMRTLLINEVPNEIEIPEEMEAVVIALKSRTQEQKEAVRDVLLAVKWLEKAGADKLYFKYCSTFDSTKEGNIGPVADAVMEYLGVDYTILCPALPVNERIVKDGLLYVKGVLLSESPMKNHPLTPMWDSRIKNLIETQSKYKAVEISQNKLQAGKEEMDEYLETVKKENHPFYVIPDYITEQDGIDIVRLFGNLRFLTGGSGILEPLARQMTGVCQQKEKSEEHKKNKCEQGGIVLAGSCSVATLGQIADYQSKGNPSYKLNPIDIYEGKQGAHDVLEFVLKHPEETVLIYSSDKAETVKEIQKLGKEKIAEMIENTLSTVAVELVKRNYGRVIVAGGETSGAVTKALGYATFKIGSSVAPGVPIMTPLENKKVKLVLKSGNFGQTDFFTRALEMTKEEIE